MAGDKVKQELVELETQSKEIVVPKKIGTPAAFHEGLKIFAHAKHFEKQVKAKKEAVTKPMNEALKTFTGMFKPLEQELGSAKSTIQKQLTEFVNQYEGKNAAKIEEIQQKLENAEITPDKALEMMEKLDTLTTSEPGVSITTFTDVVVADETKIPRKYWTIDHGKLRTDVLGIKSGDNKKPGIAVPGTRIVQKKRVV